MAEGERERVEERLLTDDEFHAALTALEDEVEDGLIDQYLDGELTGTERENFERIVLNDPERADKLRLIRALKVQAAAQEVVAASAGAAGALDPPRRGWLHGFRLFQNPLFGLSCAAALLLAVACIAWLLLKSNRLEDELRQARGREQPATVTDPGLRDELEALRSRNEELTASLRRAEEERTRLEREAPAVSGPAERVPAPPERTNPQTPQTSIASVVLSPTFRGGTGGVFTPLAIGHGMTSARLTLILERFSPADYTRLRALVKKSTGGEVWRSDAVKVLPGRRKSRAVVSVPADKLPGGQYVLELEGVTRAGQTEPVGLYSFRVVPEETSPPTKETHPPVSIPSREP